MAENSAEELQEQKPCVEGHAAEPRSAVAGWLWRLVEQVLEHQKSELVGLHTEEQKVEGWAENDEKQRSEVLPPERGSEVLNSAADDDRSSSVDWVAGEVQIAGLCLVAQDMIDSRTVVTDTVAERGVGRSVVPTAAEKNTDRGVMVQCAVRLAEVTRSVAEHARHASSPILAEPGDEVDRGSGSIRVGRLFVSQW